VRAARGREPVEANSRHPVAPLAPTPEHLLLDVQRTAGNRAATRLVQRDGPATEPATEANPAAGAGATYARVELKDFGLDFDLGTPPKRPLGGTYAFTHGVTLKPPVHPKESDLYSRDGHGFPVHSQQGTVKQPFLYQSLEPVLFPDNRPSRNDVQQESIGDCWDLSALMAIATQDRGKLMEVMTPAGDGARVKLWHYKPSAEEGKPGTWERVEIGVTGELPFKQQPGGPRQFVGAKPQTYPMRMDWWAYAHGTILVVKCAAYWQAAMWPVLLEKAHAAFVTKYGRLDPKDQAQLQGYERLGGGNAGETYYLLYGPEAAPKQTNTPDDWKLPGAPPDVVDALALAEGGKAKDGHAGLVTAGTADGDQLGRRVINAWQDVQDTKAYKAVPVRRRNDWDDLPRFIADNLTTKQPALGGAVVDAAKRLIDKHRNPTLHNTLEPRLWNYLALAEMVAGDVGGQRSFDRPHSYEVEDVSFADKDGRPIAVRATPKAQRGDLYGRIDLDKSTVSMLNPHHGGSPSYHIANPAEDRGQFSVPLRLFLAAYGHVVSAEVKEKT